MIKKFDQIDKSDTPLAGGKGASLGEMTQAGIPVPPGFVILAAVFEKFLEETDLAVELNSVFQTVDPKKMHTVESASEKIMAMITAQPIPEKLARAIEEYFRELNVKFVAVRSSATAEDSGSAAWAGQLESFLNTNEENLLENIKKCWASLYTPRAIYYRFENNLQKEKIGVAVIVQKMVESEVSGIAFSVHPVTQNPAQMIIEAGYGLGEAIVSGQITPDCYVVEKAGLSILDKNIFSQEKAIVRAATGGNRWAFVKKEIREKQKLSDAEIKKLARLVVKIENHYGFPVDVEWAREETDFYIVQSRPITTLQSNAAVEQTVYDYITTQKWFFGVRAEESLFFYSAKCDGYAKHLKKEYGAEFAETLLIPLKKDYPIRVFNLLQAKNFHAVSNEKILRAPEILVSYVEKDNKVYEDIDVLGNKLIAAVEEKKFTETVGLYKKIIELYGLASANFIIIFSLGMKLAENKDKLINIENVEKIHDIWRNSVAFKEEKMGESLFHFFKFLISRKNLKLTPQQLMKFLTAAEIDLWLDGKSADIEIANFVGNRKKHGFGYIDLKREGGKVVEERAEIAQIQKFFLQLDKESKRSINKKEFRGQVAFSSDRKIRGRVIVIKDKKDLASKKDLIPGKILVAIQTTPHFIPYMKKSRAIITDEGGLTCHAAIIAREFKKPCVVGTKIATQVLNDGDEVEVDSKNGIVIVKESM